MVVIVPRLLRQREIPPSTFWVYTEREVSEKMLIPNKKGSQKIWGK